VYSRLNITEYVTIAGTVVVADDPHTCIDADRQLQKYLGGSKRISMSAASQVKIVFDEVDMSKWDELSLFLLVSGQATITVNEVDYELKGSRKFKQYLFDCSSFGKQKEIILSSVDGATLALFLPCVRSARIENIDKDILEALKDRLSIIDFKYPFQFELTADVAAGDEDLPLNDIADVPECAVLRMPDDLLVFTNDERSIEAGSVHLTEPLKTGYTAGSSIEVFIPVLTEHDDHDYDPVVLIMQTEFGRKLFSDEDIERYKNGQVIKRWLSPVFVAVAVDCKFADVVASLTRQLEASIDPAFSMILDGEIITVDVTDSMSILETEIGNNPRTTYTLEVAPQPVTVLKPEQNTINFEITSKGVNEIDYD